MSASVVPWRASADEEGAAAPQVQPLRPELERGRRLTDVGNAERLVMQHGRDLRYCAQLRAWFAWDGKRFRPDDDGEIVRRAKAVALSLYHEAAAAPDRGERARIAKHATASEREAAIRAMIALAATDEEIQVRVEDLDADPYALNLLNGIVDLRTGRLSEHRREALCTKLVPIRLDPDASCPRWMRFLDEIFAGDGDRIGFVQRFAGYSLTGSTIEQCFALAIGSGANGKTTLLETLRKLLGEYARQADFGTFLEQRGQGPRNDVARLVGARLVTAIEANEGKVLDEAVIKALTGSEVVSARKLYHEAFEFQPTFKMWLAANHRPAIRGTDLGIWRRIRLIPFDVTFPEESRDEHLLETLEGELPGILGWALDGAILWAREGLGIPTIIRDATAEYRAECDIVAAFVDEACEVGGQFEEGANALYAGYTAWCVRNGHRPANNTVFGRKLTDLGFGKTKQGTVRRLGLRLRLPQLDGLDSSRRVESDRAWGA